VTLPSRSTARLNDGQLTRLASRLTDRDRRIALDCYEHRLLTTEQLRRLHFTTPRKARRRLSELYELRVLDRFRPAWQQGEGSTPHHWTLDIAGAHVVAAVRGVTRKELHWTREPAAALTTSTIREHLIAVNEFATRLHEEALDSGGALTEWLGERGAHDLMRGILTPDSYLALDLPRRQTRHVLLELDRGTEDHVRLQAKTRRYAKAIPRSRLAKLDPLVLLLVPSVGRARAVTASLAGSPVPIAVRPWTPGQDATLDLTADATGGLDHAALSLVADGAHVPSHLQG
jgi:hypothetical protein